MALELIQVWSVWFFPVSAGVSYYNNI